MSLDGGPDRNGSGPFLSWRAWIALGLAVDALLWAPACRVGLAFWEPRLWMAMLMCWSHLFFLPALFLDPDHSPERLVRVALRGAVRTAAATVLGAIAGLVTGIGLFISLALADSGRAPGVVNSFTLLDLWVFGSFATGGVIAALCGARLARGFRGEATGPDRVRVAFSGAIASLLLSGPALWSPKGGPGESFAVLFSLALPCLILARPVRGT